MEHASRQFQPDKITAYFRLEWVNLLLITLSGLLYNLGLLAGPWFEGKLAQCLADILDGSKTAAAMVYLVLSDITVTLLVQGARRINKALAASLRAGFGVTEPAAPTPAAMPVSSATSAPVCS